VTKTTPTQKCSSQNPETKTPLTNNSYTQSPTIKRPTTVTQSESPRTRSEIAKETAQYVDYDSEDRRPGSPLTWNDLEGGDVGSSVDDSNYHPNGENDDDSDSNSVGEEVITDDIDDNGAGEEATTYDSDDTGIENVETSDDEWNKLENLGNKIVTFQKLNPQ